MLNRFSKNSGFTIIELLIVIVIIGILTAISVVTYGGITSGANEAAVSSTVSQIGKEVALHSIKNGSPPSSLTEISPSDVPSDIEFEYYATSPGAISPEWCLKGTKNDVVYSISGSGGSVIKGDCFSPLGKYSAADYVSGVQSIVFVGAISGSGNQYSFDFRNDATVYSYTGGAGVSGGAVRNVNNGINTSYYSGNVVRNVFVGQRYSQSEKWLGSFLIETYAQQLTIGQIDVIAQRLQASLQR